MTVSGKRILPVVLGVLMTSAVLGSALPASRTYASQITPRKLVLEAGTGDVNGDGIPDGGSTPGATVKHEFFFTVPSSTSVQSIKFKYCTKARDTSCVTPTGMDASAAGVGTLSPITGWTIYAAGTNTNTVTLTNASPVSVAGADDVQLTGIKNTTDANSTFYVDIATYTSADGSGTPVDEGWVAGATANQIVLTGTMPESLVFCAGAAIAMNGSTPDCSNVGGASITFNQLFSPTATATATSDVAASTNAGSGYAITVNGPTMTSGGNTITPMDNGSGGPTTSVIGTSQFGMNLAVNTTPAVGAAINPASGTSVLRAEPTASYGTADNFLYKTAGDTVADSNAGGSDLQRYTISYMVNVDGAQTAGTYTTTLTYICTSTF